MPISKTNIGNMALGHLAISQRISNIDTDTGILAKTLQLYYDVSLEKCLAAREWLFAGQEVELTLFESNPSIEWDYSYAWPELCVQPRRIISGDRNETDVGRIPFTIRHSANGRMILTDYPDAVMLVTKLVTDTTLFSADFSLAVSYLLAHFSAPSIADGDPYDLGAKAFSNYILMIGDASTLDEASDSNDPPPVSSIEAARGG